MNLNPEQQDAVDALNEFLLNDEKYFLLKGSAGTGKTSTITYGMIDYFKHAKFLNSMSKTNVKLPFTWVFTAYTHKAVRSINESITKHFKFIADDTDRNSLNVEFSTLHKKFNLVVKKDYSTGKTFTHQTHPPAISNTEILVVDEYSMVDWQIFKYIEQSGMKVIFMGDSYQLLPVAGKLSEAFESKLFNPEYVKTLTKVERQSTANSKGLVDLLSKVRDAVDTKQFPSLDTVLPSLEIIRDRSRLKEVIHEEMIDAKHTHNSKVLAWRNDNVEAYNTYIAQQRLGTSKPVKGQEYVLSRAINSIPMNTEDTVVIDEVFPDSYDSEMGTERITFYSYEYPFEIATTRYVSNRAVFDKAIRLIKKEAKLNRDWSTYFQIMESVVDIRKSFSQTVHKAQGSTYKTVIVDMEDILQCKNKDTVRRLLYVAFTRPSTKLYVYVGEHYEG